MSSHQQRSSALSKSFSDRRPFATTLALWCLGAIAAFPVLASAFELDDISSRATGLGGAVVAHTGQPAALYYNVGGLAFVDAESPTKEIGVTASLLSQSIFQGLPPGPGVGTTGEQDEFVSYRPHIFWVKPISQSVRIGVGHYQAFGFETEWLEPDTFSGRFLSAASELTAMDINAGAAIRLTEDLGIGIGVVYRASELVVQQRLQASVSELGFTEAVEFATFDLDTATDDGFGWHAGIQNRLGKAFSWGLSYRSEIEIDYQGVGKLTQIKTGNDQLDALFLEANPFGQNLGFVTSLTFPAQASFGVAFGSEESFLVEADANRTSWSDFEGLGLAFPSHPLYDQALSCAALTGANRCSWNDTTTYRIGLQLSTSHGTEFRFGAVMDKTPQPVEDLGPLFPDGDRTTFTAGIGRDWLDVAVSWTEVERRTTTTNFDNFNGTYSGNVWVVSFTVRK